MLRISVVVPTYKRPELLRRCIEALLRQDIDPCSFEVVVADDGPWPCTRDIVAALAIDTLVPLRYVPVTATQGPAAARNAGWRAAKAPILAFTDDDCIPEPDWLRHGLAAFDGDAADVAAVWGAVVVPVPAVPTD